VYRTGRAYKNPMRAFLDRLAPRPGGSRVELAAETVAVAVRWFGLGVGLLVAYFGHPAHPLPLALILLLGLLYTAADTAFSLSVLVAAMESLFIGMLCYFEEGLDSPFRFYYLLSLIAGAVRHTPKVTLVTCLMVCVSYSSLLYFVKVEQRDWTVFAFTLIVLLWVTGAAVALARLLKRAASDLTELNAELTANKALLETRIADRTRELEESQAQVLHGEKMAAFGLLAAGIAHEVGNPLAGISAVVQMLDRREQDGYTREKLGLVHTQLARIQMILRELIGFSRPASVESGRVNVREVIDEALGIAKYYRGGKTRVIASDVPAELPPLVGVRDQFVQVVFNLVLNAIDATDKGGTIRVTATADAGAVVLSVADDGCGIPPDAVPKLFRPYFTTKKHGTGLGLFVLKRIAEAHGGTVEVLSAVGEGTTFRVRIPVQDDSPQRAQRTQREEERELLSPT
jgi:two-component system, NtrC family, sensor kinase